MVERHLKIEAKRSCFTSFYAISMYVLSVAASRTLLCLLFPLLLHPLSVLQSLMLSYQAHAHSDCVDSVDGSVVVRANPKVY